MSIWYIFPNGVRIRTQLVKKMDLLELIQQAWDEYSLPGVSCLLNSSGSHPQRNAGDGNRFFPVIGKIPYGWTTKEFVEHVWMQIKNFPYTWYRRHKNLRVGIRRN